MTNCDTMCHPEASSGWTLKRYGAQPHVAFQQLTLQAVCMLPDTVKQNLTLHQSVQT